MVLEYMIPVYAYLIKCGWALEPTGAEGQNIIPESYRLPVAEHLATEQTT